MRPRPVLICSKQPFRGSTFVPRPQLFASPPRSPRPQGGRSFSLLQERRLSLSQERSLSLSRERSLSLLRGRSLSLFRGSELQLRHNQDRAKRFPRCRRLSRRSKTAVTSFFFDFLFSFVPRAFNCCGLSLRLPQCAVSSEAL